MQSLNIKDACALLGVSRQTIYNEISAGRLRTFKIGRRRLVEQNTINEYVRTLEKKANSPINLIEHENKSDISYIGSHGYPDVPRPEQCSGHPPCRSGVYFFWDGDKVVYVGVSKNLERRIKEHKGSQTLSKYKLSFLLFPERQAMYAEAFYIGSCRPKHNWNMPDD